MEVIIKYGSSIGPHKIHVGLAEIEEMGRTGDPCVRQEGKRLTINGSTKELVALAEALLRVAEIRGRDRSTTDRSSNDPRRA